MSRPGHRDRDKYEPPNPRRSHVILSAEDVANGKETSWCEMEIIGLFFFFFVYFIFPISLSLTDFDLIFFQIGSVRNLSPQLWNLTHLTTLYLNDNCLTRLPQDICHLTALQHLDLSNNKLRNLPQEIGDLILLRELYLDNNNLRFLPYELGKLFQLQNLGKSWKLGTKIISSNSETIFFQDWKTIHWQES